MSRTNGQAAPALLLAVEPLLVNGDAAGRLVGISGRSWRRLAAEGNVPPPVKLGNRVLWRLQDLRSWASDRCPSGERWEILESKRLEPLVY